MPARRDTRSEAARLRRLAPLQALEDQSQAWGLCCHSCTWREGLTLSWKLSYQVNIHLAIYPEAEASFRSTDRTSMKAVLIRQPVAASTCLTPAKVPNTTRERTATNRCRRVVLST
jgi:hypothetical protein